MKQNWKTYGKMMMAAVFLTAAGLYYGFAGKTGEMIRLEETKISAEMGNSIVSMETMSGNLIQMEKVQAEEMQMGQAQLDLEQAKTDQIEQDQKELLYVHVCGEVKCPGVYGLPEGSRVFEAVEAAGGLTDQAAEASLNQALKIEDGMQILVLSADQAAEQKQAQAEVESGLVNLNTAPKETLMTLPGIGESRAEAIIRYREEAGGFRTAEEIMNVSGIKQAAYDKIKDKITI